MATNALGPYAEIDYVNEALITVASRMGMANRVFRYGEDTTMRRGSVVTFAQPSTFTATSVPDTSQQSVDPDEVSLTLDQHQGVEFGLSSKELATSRANIVQDHIIPAAIAVADKIDLSLTARYVDIPWVQAATATPTDVSDITAVRKILQDRKVPFDGNVHFMLSPEREAKFLNLSAFAQYQGAGDVGAATQRDGDLGRRYGMNFFTNQNVATHDTTPLTSVTALQANAEATAGATSIVVKDSDGTLAGTISAGDTFSIAGITQRFVVTANATAASNLFTLSIQPPLPSTVAADAVITLTQSDATENLAFHRNAYALAFAKLPEYEPGQGIRVASIFDPVTRIALRMSMWVDANNDKQKFRVDALWGVKVLNRNLACRYRVA